MSLPMASQELLFAVGVLSFKGDPDSTARMRALCRRERYLCPDCGREVCWKDTAAAEGVLGPDLCRTCLQAAELENEHQDGYHDAQPNADCPACVDDVVAAAEAATAGEVPPPRTAAGWHAYIRSAPNSAVAGDRMEEARAAGVHFTALNSIDDEETQS